MFTSSCLDGKINAFWSGKYFGEVGIITGVNDNTAQALFALKLKANKVHITETPKVCLFAAHHPLLWLDNEKKSVANEIHLGEEQRTLIISGPNAGGKTVILKTVGMIQLMVASGLMVPCREDSQLYLFDNLYVELGDSQNLSANLSSFSGHMQGIKSILSKASKRDLVLFDELAIGTEPLTGAAIAQAVLEELSDLKVVVIVTTHYESLKHLAYSNSFYRNGSMEYALDQEKPTYHLILDIPGQSYGLELAKKIGLKLDLVERAKSLKGEGNQHLDEMIIDLTKARDKLRLKEKNYQEEVDKLKKKTLVLDEELIRFKKTKGETIQNLVKDYEKKLVKIHEEFSKMKGEFKQVVKNIQAKYLNDQQGQVQKITQVKDKTKEQIDRLNQELLDIRNKHINFDKPQKLPGHTAKFENLVLGAEVYVISLKQEGVLVKIGSSFRDKLEIN